MSEPIHGTSMEVASNIAADENFKFIVEKEVRARTDEQLGAWWKKLVGILGVILGIVGFFGIKEWLSFRDLIESVKKAQGEVEATRRNLEQRLSEANNKIGQADALLQSSKSLAGIVEQSVASSRQGTKDSQELVTRSLDFLAESRRSVRESMASMEERQQVMLDRAQSINDQMSGTVTQGLADLQNTQKEMSNARAQIIKVLEAKTEVDKAYDSIRSKLDEAQGLTTLVSDLNKAKTFTFFMLEEGDSRIVEIGGDEIRFSIDEIAESVDLEVQVNNVGEGGLMFSPQVMRKQVRGSKFPVDHTNNIWCEVNAIRSRRFGPDFIFLRLFAR